MSNTTVSLSQPVDSCPPCLRDLAAGEPSHCVCGSFMTALCYTSARLSPGCTEEVGEGASETPGSVLRLQAPARRHRCHSALHVASRKIAQTASVTHARESVITGAPYCVFTLKVVQVSIGLGAQQRCTRRLAHSGRLLGECKLSTGLFS